MVPYLRLIGYWLTGWGKRKKFTVAATADLRFRILDFTIFNTSGSDTLDTVYLNGQVRSDWGDIRITKSDGLTRIPWGILRKTSTSIVIAFLHEVIAGDTEYYIYYDGPAASVFKIGNITDQHYDAGSSFADRDEALNYIDNFKTRMATYVPDMVVSNGDMTGFSNTTSATQLTWMQAVLDQLTGVTGTLKRGVAMGNHDFEYITFANVRALVDNYEAWFETGAMYGEFHSTADYKFISLDSNYDPATESHLSASHLGAGYIGGTQKSWLQSYLETADREVIVFVHHLCGEFDTAQMTLTKELYHCVDRRAIRTILEQSGKVIAVIHGHLHYHRTDIINGIPYLVCGNLTNDGVFGEIPLASDGRFEKIEFDKSTRLIHTVREALISGTWQTIYEDYIPYGKTIYSDDIGNNQEAVFKLYEGAAFAKSSYLRDPCQLYVVNQTFLYKFPVNFQTPDDAPIFPGSIRINGRTSTPNFGRALWWYENISAKFIFEGWVMVGDVSNFNIKLGGRDTTTFPACYINFNPDGNIYVYDVTTPELLSAYSVNTWYKIEMFIDPTFGGVGGYSGNIGGIPFGSPSANGFFSGPNLVFRELELVTEVGDYWIHSFSIKPWFSPRPTMEGFALEETEP